MNRGKVVSAVVLWTIAVNFLSMMPFLIEIPKLAQRADELNLKVEARDEVIQTLYKRSETLEHELENVKGQNADLNKNLQQRTQELEELRKKQTFTPVSVGDDFEVTWYNDYGHTKSGRMVADDVTVAVDPRVIELGSWVRLEFPDGRQMVRRADDTGGAVKGHIIDVYASASDHELIQRGRTRGVKVTLLRKS